MYFQVVDKKRNCELIFHNDKFETDISEDMTHTWDFSSSLEHKDDIQYANLYCLGKNLDDICPEHMRKSWASITDTFKAHLRAFHLAGIDLNDMCFYDSVPEHFLFEYYYLKNEITKHIFENFKKPRNYKFLSNLAKLANQLKEQEMCLDLSALDGKLHHYKTRAFYRKISKQPDQKIKYNIAGTKTGRLTTESDSFPILTLDRDHREILIPQNDLFLELDYNSAELRVFLGLLGIEQPKEDIHTWIGQNVFKGEYSRDTVKKKVFAWLYNPHSKNAELEKIFKKQDILNKYYKNGTIETIFGREIKADEYHALNYIIQSTTSDLFLRNIIKINHFLRKCESKIAFMIHDSVIIDFKKEEWNKVTEIVDVFSNTIFGHMPANVSIGKNYGKMSRLAL